MTATLIRQFSAPDCIIGQLHIFDNSKQRLFSCFTLELPWNDNKKTSSCIPMGSYRVTPIISTKFGPCLRLVVVPGRTGILIHAGNFAIDTHGCILVGSGFAFNTNICTNMVSNSKETLASLIHIIQSPFDLTVTSVL